MTLLERISNLLKNNAKHFLDYGLLVFVTRYNSGLSIAGGSYGFIDNASLTVTPSAVPTPPAVLLMVVGLPGLAAARQRTA